MKRALVPLGLVLLAGGPVLPSWMGGGNAVVQLVDLGRDGLESWVSAKEVALAAPASIEVREVSPGMVELRAPSSQRREVEALAQKFLRPVRSVPPCDPPAASCLEAFLRSQRMFSRPSGPVDSAVDIPLPAPRSAWLLGMLVGLAGLGVLVLGLMGWRGLAGSSLVLAVGGASVVGGVAGAVTGVVLSANVQQSLLITLPFRPLLWSTGGQPEKLEPDRDVAARVSSAGFLHGLPVSVRAIPDGERVVINVEAPTPAAADAVVERVHAGVIAPFMQEVEAFRAALDHAAAVRDGEWPLRLEIANASMLPPRLSIGPQTHDHRTPLRTGGTGAVAGALVAWAACARRRSGRN